MLIGNSSKATVISQPKTSNRFFVHGISWFFWVIATNQMRDTFYWISVEISAQNPAEPNNIT